MVITKYKRTTKGIGETHHPTPGENKTKIFAAFLCILTISIVKVYLLKFIYQKKLYKIIKWSTLINVTWRYVKNLLLNKKP